MAQRMTKRQRDIIEHLTIDTEYLVSYYLLEGGTPFDFQSIYYRITDSFDYSSVNAVSFRRTLRAMEGKGMLKRGSMVMDVAGLDNQENVREVATWHIPETFERDCKFLNALPAIDAIKHREVTANTPKEFIKQSMFGDSVDNSWLTNPLLAWMGQETPIIELPERVRQG